MGPIIVKHGTEQGGISSSEFYKIYNNDLLKIIQKSVQGVYLGIGLTISCVGQADDIGLSSNDIHCLLNILHLALTQCQQYHVQLFADKTKLLLVTRNDSNYPIFNPIITNGQQITFSHQAEHVGVIRSTDVNLPHLLSRVLNHKKAKGQILSSETGVAIGETLLQLSSLRRSMVYQYYSLESQVLFSTIGRSI